MKSRSLTKVVWVILLMGALCFIAESAFAKKPPKPKFVGSLKCDGSCHDPWYQAWAKTNLGKAYQNLKAGAKAAEKKSVGLDPDKDYSSDPACLRCHTTGYKQSGGFKVKKHANEDPTEPNFAAVGCEMCHSVLGGAGIRVLMKNKKDKFTEKESEALGGRYDYENVCKRCHGHKMNPFKAKPFNFEEKKKMVHDITPFLTPENKEQLITKKDGVSIHKSLGAGTSATTPLPIEDFEVVDGKFKKKGKWAKWDKKKKAIIWEDKG